MSCTQWLTKLGFSQVSRERFWDLIILATLNVHPDLAPANLLAIVLQEGFLKSRENSKVGLANVGLSEMYAEPAKMYIEAHRGEVRMREGVEEILISDNKVVGVDRSGIGHMVGLGVRHGQKAGDAQQQDAEGETTQQARLRSQQSRGRSGHLVNLPRPRRNDRGRRRNRGHHPRCGCRLQRRGPLSSVQCDAHADDL